MSKYEDKESRPVKIQIDLPFYMAKKLNMIAAYNDTDRKNLIQDTLIDIFNKPPYDTEPEW